VSYPGYWSSCDECNRKNQKIKNLEDQVYDLERDKRELEDQVYDLERNKRELEEQVARLRRELAQAQAAASDRYRGNAYE
jgi:predicted RNase H-like nuclease (RuvC/YqgF family)